jgi:ankyrin repeat protein
VCAAAVVQCIAAAGASFEVTDPDKGNPAQIAAYWGHLEAVVKLVEAGCSWPHGKTARGVAGGDVVKWICNITTNKVGAGLAV